MSTAEEWRQLRRQTRDQLRRLPPEVQREIRKIRRDDLRADLVCRVVDRVSERASDLRSLREPNDESGYREPRLTAVEERQVLRAMVTTEFIGWLRTEVGRILRSAHLSKIDPGQCSSLPDSLPHQAPQADGSWVPAEDLGLQIASVMDGPPEGWWALCAQIIEERSKYKSEQGEDPDLLVLAIDAGAGGLARALSTTPTEGTVLVRETGAVLSHTELPNVLGSSTRGDHASADGLEFRLPTSTFARTDSVPDSEFDVVVWGALSPTVGGAANELLPYLSPSYDGSRLVYPTTLGRLGPRRWQREVRHTISNLLGRALKPGGIAILRLPLGYRVSKRSKKRILAQHGYVACPNLIDGVLDNVSRFGLRVTTTIEEHPRGRVSQPYVGSSRCTWVTYVLVKTEASQ